MDEKRKAWCKKYNVKIADGGFIDVFCGLPKHVQIQLPYGPEGPQLFVGFDGRTKTYYELTEEEREDLNGIKERTIENLKQFCKERRESKNKRESEKER